MALSLKVHHLPRYKNIATLLVKQWRADELKDFDPADPARDGTATADDGRQLADGLESMGPTFVTLGQLLSTRADLLPPAYLEALSRLQDGVQPVRRLWCCEQPASEISRGRHRTVCQGQRCCASFSCRWFDGFARRWRWLFAPGSSGPLNPNPPASPPPGGNSSSTGTGGSKAESTHETTDGAGPAIPIMSRDGNSIDHFERTNAAGSTTVMTADGEEAYTVPPPAKGEDESSSTDNDTNSDSGTTDDDSGNADTSDDTADDGETPDDASSDEATAWVDPDAADASGAATFDTHLTGFDRLTVAGGSVVDVRFTNTGNPNGPVTGIDTGTFDPSTIGPDGTNASTVGFTATEFMVAGADLQVSFDSNQFEAIDNLDTGLQLDTPDEVFDAGMEAGNEIGGESNGSLPFP